MTILNRVSQTPAETDLLVEPNLSKLATFKQNELIYKTDLCLNSFKNIVNFAKFGKYKK
jgi:hypothetical protein